MRHLTDSGGRPTPRCMAEESPAGRDVLGGGEQIPRARPDPRLELHSAPGVLSPLPDGIEILPVHTTI